MDEVPNQALIVPLEVFGAEVALTRGDRVKLSYQDTGEGDLSVSEFDNLTFTLKVSAPQEQHLQEQQAEKAETSAELEAREAELRRQ